MLALQSQERQVFATGIQGLLGLAVQSVYVLPHLVGLLLYLPLGRHHLDYAALHVAQHLKLLFVGIVQRLPGVFRIVQNAVHLDLTMVDIRESIPMMRPS